MSAAGGASPGINRSAASTMVTEEPSLAKACPSSQPIGPPPSTRSRRGSSVRDHTESEVRGAASARPGRSGTTGEEPVATSAWVKLTRSPSTVADVGPVKTTVPWATEAPAARIAAGESTGSMVVIEARTCSITASKSTDTESTWTPREAAARASPAACAAASSALLGTQPVHRQSPPVRSRSTRRVVAPNPAAVWAATRPAVPPPTIRRSHGRESGAVRESEDHAAAAGAVPPGVLMPSPDRAAARPWCRGARARPGR